MLAGDQSSCASCRRQQLQGDPCIGMGGICDGHAVDREVPRDLAESSLRVVRPRLVLVAPMAAGGDHPHLDAQLVGEAGAGDRDHDDGHEPRGMASVPFQRAEHLLDVAQFGAEAGDERDNRCTQLTARREIERRHRWPDAGGRLDRRRTDQPGEAGAIRGGRLAMCSCAGNAGDIFEMARPEAGLSVEIEITALIC